MKHYLGVCLVLVTLAGIGWFALRSCTQAVDRTIDHVRDAFVSVLQIQPRITVNQRVVLTQTAPIAELAVVSKEELVTIGLNEHLEVLSVQIPLTEKSLTAEATFRIKAGFDLKKPFSVEIDPVTHTLHAAMPHAEILSVEQIGDLVYHGDDALLNRITDDERTRILSNLNAAAHDAAEKSTLKSEADQQLTQRLKELMNHNGQTLQIEWDAKPADFSGKTP
ncbi:MAG: DUF4230 domain-containing protein [Methylacidiphilales bacterium]|nr:DUF4230 domain-containing protein [Candidatus Methylacidiphilales bacterium]